MPRRRSKTSKGHCKARERERKAIAMRLEGKGYQAIADTLGVSIGCAHRSVARVLEREAKKTAEDAKMVLALELKRLDEMQAGLMPLATQGVIRVAVGDEDDTAMAIEASLNQQMRAVDRCVRLQERRAKLLGLDAPPRERILDEDVHVVVRVPQRKAPEGQSNDD